MHKDIIMEKMDEQLVLICDDREAEGKHGSGEKMNDQQNQELKER